MTDQQRNQRHEARMKKTKTIVDEKISYAQEEKGVFILMTGNGKGKSSSAFGTAIRALAHGQKVGIVQFLKGAIQTGEALFFNKQDSVEFHAMGDGFTWETQNREQDIATAQAAWQKAKAMLEDVNYNLVILDEITYLFKYDYLDIHEVLNCIQQRPERQNIILTGRGARPELKEAADTVSIIADEKHAFHLGIKAQKGIEY